LNKSRNPLKIVVAPDSFKHSLSASKAAERIKTGILKASPHAEVMTIPMSDGGEGLVNALVDATKGKTITAAVKNPLGRSVESFFGLLGDGQTAAIEMAAASGIELITEDERDPLITSTYGTGQLIKEALDQGCNKIIVGIGGSATNDGGAGMAQALGVKLLNKNGDEIGSGGGELKNLAEIDMSGLDERLKSCRITAACDVTNPLTGKNGASLVYGGQKGGSEAVLKKLDKNLAHYAAIIRRDLGIDVTDIPGSGAAGGLGAGLLAFLNAELISGFNVVKDVVNLESHIAKCDMVISGEGKIDSQSFFGKTPMGVAQVAKQYDKPVILIAGSIGEGIEKLYDQGVDAVFSIVSKPMTLEEAIENTGDLLENLAENVMRLVSSEF
jgi:glycerate kinase